MLLDCGWNFRPDHCIYGPSCPSNELMLLHGSRGVFANTKDTPKARPVNVQPAFKACYDAFAQDRVDLLATLRMLIGLANKSRCAQSMLPFLEAAWR
eukprot:m.93096 g.93096  ORF g.93096 m.93096 type:complete len:97 (-) comp14971_c2_seq21:529-819(-)